MLHFPLPSCSHFLCCSRGSPQLPGTGFQGATGWGWGGEILEKHTHTHPTPHSCQHERSSAHGNTMEAAEFSDNIRGSLNWLCAIPLPSNNTAAIPNNSNKFHKQWILGFCLFLHNPPGSSRNYVQSSSAVIAIICTEDFLNYIQLLWICLSFPRSPISSSASCVIYFPDTWFKSCVLG